MEFTADAQRGQADDEDVEKMMALCGEFCKKIADDFHKELSTKGYIELNMSPPENYLNSVPVGIDFSLDQYDQYEISFTFKKGKVLIYELTMASLPRVK